MLTWDYLYNLIGIRDFIYFISSPSIQDALFPVKIVFICFTAFFFCAVIWFYVNSSYIRYQFLQDATEFISHEAYGLAKMNKSWKKIKKKAESGVESEVKIAVIEADDFFYQTLQDTGFQGDSFEELVAKAGAKLPNSEDLLRAHEARNAIVYNPDYQPDSEALKNFVLIYESASKNITIA